MGSCWDSCHGSCPRAPPSCPSLRQRRRQLEISRTSCNPQDWSHTVTRFLSWSVASHVMAYRWIQMGLHEPTAVPGKQRFPRGPGTVIMTHHCAWNEDWSQKWSCGLWRLDEWQTGNKAGYKACANCSKLLKEREQTTQLGVRHLSRQAYFWRIGITFQLKVFAFSEAVVIHSKLPWLRFAGKSCGGWVNRSSLNDSKSNGLHPQQETRIISDLANCHSTAANAKARSLKTWDSGATVSRLLQWAIWSWTRFCHSNAGKPESETTYFGHLELIMISFVVRSRAYKYIYMLIRCLLRAYPICSHNRRTHHSTHFC